MGGGASKYTMEHTSEKSKKCGWLLTSHDQVSGPLTMDAFSLKVVIGKGKFGLVYTAEQIATKKYVAIKFISKEIINETKGVQRIQQEMNILQEIRHPFIVHCFGVFEIETAFALLFDYASGGELYTRIRKEEKFKEPVAKFYFCEMTSALGYLHDKHIVYRDLKPENILLDNDGHIKICDFGFAVELSGARETLSDGCGSAMYVAPEIAGGMMKHSHGLPVDWWSLGCILFEMVTGEAPFGDIDRLSKFEIFNNINGKQVSLPMSASATLKDLVAGLLCKDPTGRFAKQHVMQAAWVSDVDWRSVASKNYTPPWLPPGRGKYNTGQYVDWPKESLSKMKVPSTEEAAYCSNITCPQVQGQGKGSRATLNVAVGASHHKPPAAAVAKKNSGSKLAASDSGGVEVTSSEGHPLGKAGAGRKSHLDLKAMKRASSKKLDTSTSSESSPSHGDAMKHRKASPKNAKSGKEDPHHHHGHGKH